MRDGETVRNVAIVADGSTDHQVLAKLIDVFVHSQRTDIINFRFHHLEELNLRDDVDRFRRDASKNDQYGLHQKPARRLQQAVLDILLTAAGQFQDSAGEHLTDSDLLLLNTDAESHLRESGRYFDDPWAVALRRSFDHAIERFYHLKAAREHLPMEYAPMILPLIFFPSTDILVATVEAGPVGRFPGNKSQRNQDCPVRSSRLAHVGRGGV